MKQGNSNQDVSAVQQTTEQLFKLILPVSNLREAGEEGERDTRSDVRAETPDPRDDRSAPSNFKVGNDVIYFLRQHQLSSKVIRNSEREYRRMFANAVHVVTVLKNESNRDDIIGSIKSVFSIKAKSSDTIGILLRSLVEYDEPEARSALSRDKGILSFLVDDVVGVPPSAVDARILSLGGLVRTYRAYREWRGANKTPGSSTTRRPNLVKDVLGQNLAHVGDRLYMIVEKTDRGTAVNTSRKVPSLSLADAEILGRQIDAVIAKFIADMDSEVGGASA